MLKDKEEIAALVQSMRRREGGTGPGTYLIRCRVPFNFDCPGPGAPLESRSREGEARAEGDGEPDEGMITGPASSTSVDWYGTRMGLAALEDMKKQFQAGVDYFPRHHHWLNPVEWNEVIGTTVGAELKKEQVQNPHEGAKKSEQQVLYVDTQLDMDEELAQKLLRRARAGAGPGQSIGGWFTGMAITFDDDDNVTDREVTGIELDHLAAVRSPANPDADRIWETLSQEIADLYSLSKGTPGTTEAPAAPENSEEDPGPAQSRSATSDGGSSEQRVMVPSDGENSDPENTTQGSEDALSEDRTTDPSNEQEIDMDPTELAAVLEASIARAIEPLNQRLDTLEGGAQTEPNPNPDPAPQRAAPQLSEADMLRQQLAESEARNVVAEARNAALVSIQAAQPSAPAGRSSVQRTAQPEGTREERIAAREAARRAASDYHGIDIRDVAPNAVKAVGRSYGEVDLTPGLVAQLDGPKALAQMAAADGSAVNLSTFLTEEEPDIFDRRALTKRSRGDLEDVLSEVLWKGMQDGLIRKTSTPVNTSWA